MAFGAEYQAWAPLPGDLDLDEKWVEIVWRVVGKFLAKNLNSGQPATISYGSDCSGIDAPFWALRQIIAAKLPEAPNFIE